MFSSRASCDAANVPGWWRSPPTPPRNLCPTMPKARPQTGKPPHRETHPGSDSGGGRQRQSPHHPRLCENHKRSLIGGPRKMGVQGVGDIGAGPAQPVLSLCAHPRCFFGFFLGIQKEARRRSGEIPRTRHRRCQTTGPWCGGYRKRVVLLPCASCGAANAPGWWRSPPTPPRNLCPTMPKARPQPGKPPHRETHPGRGSSGGGKVNPHTTRAFALPCHAP